MPNAGHPRVREAVAGRLRTATGLPYTANHVLMTVGAGAALNTVLKALLNPGDEVLTVAPFFVEYKFYAENYGGRLGRRAAARRPHAGPGPDRGGHHAADAGHHPQLAEQSERRHLPGVHVRRARGAPRPDRPADRAHQRRALPRPGLRRRDGPRGAAAGDPRDRGHVLVEVAGHPRRADRLSRVLAAHAGSRRAVRGVHVHQPRPRLRERARRSGSGWWPRWAIW